MIHEVLLDLSQKADNIINSKIGFNMDFIKRVTEKALAIVACKSLEELESFSISETPRKSLKKSDHFEENKIHLHSNKNSLENESEFINDNIMPSTQEEGEEDIEVNPNRDNCEEEHNTNKNKTNEIYNDFLPTRTLQANISNSSKEANSYSNKVVSDVCESMPFDKIKNNIDDNIIQETSISNDNVTIQNSQWRKFNEEPILKSGNQTIIISDSDSSNEVSVETETPPIFETSLKHTKENLKNEDENTKNRISEKFIYITQIWNLQKIHSC
ncbi:hypothetical protein CEXT_116821 [Caerostris extrusa]|uniref:Uncharacterized protein n=1 Tax=Caerostris extrusa TaxID=172846 RepID=A0AAV4PRG9_CAEEX|nr:hypothetical protein CEXT_116821 [Caerostris extrusa]